MRDRDAGENARKTQQRTIEKQGKVIDKLNENDLQMRNQVVSGFVREIADVPMLNVIVLFSCPWRRKMLQPRSKSLSLRRSYPPWTGN